EYMAPEAWDMSPSMHSDQFALAVTTYVLLCGHGKYPFRSRDDILSGAAIPMKNQAQQYGALHAELEAVIQRGYARREEDRYASVSEYTLVLRDVLNYAANSRPPGSIFPVPDLSHTQPGRQIPPTILAVPYARQIPPTEPARPWTHPVPIDQQAFVHSPTQPAPKETIPVVQPVQDAQPSPQSPNARRAPVT